MATTLNFYPHSLPCASRVEGHSAVAYAGIIRTPMTAGNTRQRRAHRQLPQQIALAFVVPQTQLADWMAWVNENAFDTWFAMNLPGVLASRAGNPTAPVPIRFTSDIQLELLTVERLWYWRIRVDAEWMPTVEDLAPGPLWVVATRPGEATGLPWIIAGDPATPAPDWIIAGDPAAPSASRAHTLQEMLT